MLLHTVVHAALASLTKRHKSPQFLIVLITAVVGLIELLAKQWLDTWFGKDRVDLFVVTALLAAVMLIGVMMAPVMIVLALIPARRASATLIEKRLCITDEDGYAVTKRVFRFSFEGTELEFNVDEWTYNRRFVGDEGCLEYKKSEFVAFTLKNQATSSHVK